MKKVIAPVLVLVALAASAVYWSAHPAKSVGVRATEAYRRGDYAAALPLLKEWAALPEVVKDTDKRGVVLAYILDVEGRLKPEGTVGAGGGSAPGAIIPKPQAAPFTAAQLIANAEAKARADAQALSENPVNRVPHLPVKAGEVRALTIKQLGNFNYDAKAGGNIPADVMALDGATLRLQGYMLPLNQTLKVTDFALVPSLFACCFGQPPGVQHVITCQVPLKEPVEVFNDKVVVEGILHVREKRVEGYTDTIFEMSVTSLKVAE